MLREGVLLGLQRRWTCMCSLTRLGISIAALVVVAVCFSLYSGINFVFAGVPCTLCTVL